MKKILSIWFTFALFGTVSVFADEASENCEVKEDHFDRYTCRVASVCEEYKENKVVYNTVSYDIGDTYTSSSDSVFLVSGRSESALKSAVKTYKDNMNSIYNCAMVGVQKNTVSLIKSKLFALDKTGDIKKLFEPKLEKLSTKLENYANTKQCQNIDKETVFNKLSILRQTTYETCKFDFYMDYLRHYYQDGSKAFEGEFEEKDSLSLNKAHTKMKAIGTGIDQEISQAHKTFSLTFHAYCEYENNLPVHLLLQLIKQDLIIYRDKLYQAINPINQVVYKISNAMNE